MRAKSFLVILALSVFCLMCSCEHLGEEIEDRIAENTGETCVFQDLQTIPQYMRNLRDEYNTQMLTPDSEGNMQSYEKCKANLEAAEAYRNDLNNVIYLLDDYCPERNSKLNQEHRAKVVKLRSDLKRQIDETDCESAFGVDD
ncbi:hypothetical protein QSE00_16335 [Arenibacter sp. M-2]|uniref:hypothetical protein n=1 Tax=Arenibacter sp. M-2 TaxID=3053612 RepID=UPI002570D73D|nr:hypothetical protein [Arenibacter sp. M-2]MDL5513395.1 hypothetical protein [Arenibacter sp. M-2]|tara:strand:+ start:307 stop:735 length:429 start_codon:yes stop_codon:yes gene_type:complete